MNNIKFLHPNIFYLTILFIIIFIVIKWYTKKTNKKLSPSVSVPFLEDLQKATKKTNIIENKKIYIWLKNISFFVSVILISIALARPQQISSEEKVIKNGVDILITLDISESMLAEDLKPNRLKAAKEYIDNFISKLKTDRVGLEVFAGKAFVQSPITFDYNVVRYYLSQITTNTINQRLMGLGGTAIGDALLSGINRFKNSPDRTKVIILLTDGETNIGANPVFVAEQARVAGIKIYTIGLGSKKGSKIFMNGRYYTLAFNEEDLKNIAQISGGKYFWAGNNNTLEKSLNTIQQLEKKEYKAEPIIKRKDLFWNWLFFGFIFSLLTILFQILTQEIKINTNLTNKK